MKSDFEIKFWYFDDLRFDCRITAMNEIHALVLATEEYKVLKDGWATASGFTIEISKVAA